MASERPQFIQRFQRTAEATDTAEEIVQSVPGKAALVAISQRIGFRDAPFHKRIPFHAVGVVSVGSSAEPMLFISGKADAIGAGATRCFVGE